MLADYRLALSIPAIAAATGIHENHLGNIESGRHVRVRTYTAKRLAALGVPAVGDKRRLRGLLHIGHPLATIAAATGLDLEYLQAIANCTCRTVLRDVHAAIGEFWDEWVAIDGPCADTAAENSRYSPPWAWADETMDDPKTRPWKDVRGKHTVDEVKVARMCGGEQFAEVTVAEGREAVRILHHQRNCDNDPMTANEIADLLHTTSRNVQRIRTELGLECTDRYMAWGRVPRGTLAEHLRYLYSKYTRKQNSDRKLWKADARTALADLRIAYDAAGLPWPGAEAPVVITYAPHQVAA